LNKQDIGIYAGSKVPQTLKNAIQKAVVRGSYLNASDFIRDAIKEKLQREGFLQFSEINDIMELGENNGQY
jgi:Arc/MetJ-type ribon-helix-helix transcriptional regulator